MTLVSEEILRAADEQLNVHCILIAAFSTLDFPVILCGAKPRIPFTFAPQLRETEAALIPTKRLPVNTVLVIIVTTARNGTHVMSRLLGVEKLPPGLVQHRRLQCLHFRSFAGLILMDSYTKAGQVAFLTF